jgi:hypothetical protein
MVLFPRRLSHWVSPATGLVLLLLSVPLTARASKNIMGGGEGLAAIALGIILLSGIAFVLTWYNMARKKTGLRVLGFLLALPGALLSLLIFFMGAGVWSFPGIIYCVSMGIMISRSIEKA